MIENKNTNSIQKSIDIIFSRKKARVIIQDLKNINVPQWFLNPGQKRLFYTVLHCTHEFRVVTLLVTLAEWVMCFVVNYPSFEGINQQNM